MKATGIPLSYVIVLNENNDGTPASGQTAAIYAKSLGLKNPVTLDGSYQTYAMTPWDGAARPGKLALAPDMTILKFYEGTDDTPGLDAIKAHHAAHPSL